MVSYMIPFIRFCLLVDSVWVVGMPKKDKREEKIRKNPANVSLEDFEWLINRYGYIKEGRSHPKARIGTRTMPYKRGTTIKPVYVKEVLRIIDGI